MHKRLIALPLLGALGLLACGDSPTQVRSVSPRLTLMNDVAFFSSATLSDQQALYQQLVTASAFEANIQGATKDPLLFPIVGRDVTAASPGLPTHLDLFRTFDSTPDLVLDERISAKWGSAEYFGLTEEQAYRRVAMALIAHFRWEPPADDGSIKVTSAPGSPYAAAYIVDSHTLVLNPVFVSASVAQALSETSSRTALNQ